MSTSHKAVLFASVLLSIAVPTIHVQGAQVLTKRPSELRYQTMLSEPIATPNGGGAVAGTSAMLVKDRVTRQCFLAITVGSAMGLSPADCGE